MKINYSKLHLSRIKLNIYPFEVSGFAVADLGLPLSLFGLVVIGAEFVFFIIIVNFLFFFELLRYKSIIFVK